MGAKRKATPAPPPSQLGPLDAALVGRDWALLLAAVSAAQRLEESMGHARAEATGRKAALQERIDGLRAAYAMGPKDQIDPSTGAIVRAVP